MERKFESFVKQLSDHELAIYIGYQYESLLAYSKEIIDKELTVRGLTKNVLEAYLTSRLPMTDENDTEPCERCGSAKFFEDIDTAYENGKYSVDIYEVKTKRCRLCHLNPSKQPPANLFKRVKWYLLDRRKSQTITYVTTIDWLKG